MNTALLSTTPQRAALLMEGNQWGIVRWYTYFHGTSDLEIQTGSLWLRRTRMDPSPICLVPSSDLPLRATLYFRA